ncbi:MAG: OmpA family protein [Fibrobacteres bacterium]|nr:OmpA family protein [Fibrobacterota bacterium]
MLTPARVPLAKGKESSRIQLPLRPIACSLLPDHHFEFDSSFIRPDAGESLSRLAAKRKVNPGSPITLFGHADPVGQDDYNKGLSDRRVRAVYGLLTRDASIWEDIFSHPAGNDNWGQKSVQNMLLSAKHDPGAIDGKSGAKTRQATLDFQKEKGLAQSGWADLNTRKALFEAYMDALYGTDFKPLDPVQDFLARKADGKGKGDFQGCGEFNPILMFSLQESKDLEKDKPKRNTENTPNRRVIAYLFEPGTVVDPKLWPCPRAGEGTSACKARFFSDAAKRRSFQAQRRQYENTRDTFACRFYDMLAGDMPCESVAGGIPTTLSMRLMDPRGKRMPKDTPFRVHIAGTTRDGALAEDGLLVMDDVLLRDVDLVEWGKDFLSAETGPDASSRLRQKITKDFPRHPFVTGFKSNPLGADTFLFQCRPILDSRNDEVDDPTQMDKRLGNMGYKGDAPVDARLDTFRIEFRLEKAPDEGPKVGLRDVHRDGTEIPDPPPGNGDGEADIGHPEEDIPTLEDLQS